jgi:hypothetical protein
MADKRVNILINARDNASATFKKVAVGIGGLFAAGKMVGWTKDIINMGDAIGKASKRAGMSAEEWQKLKYAAEVSGASAGDVETAFKKMSSTIFDANKGMKTAQDALAALGLNYAKIANMSPERQFAEIAARLNLVKNATDKAAIAQDIFGRSGTMLLPMIGNYEQIGKHLENIGGIIKNDVVAASESFNDQIKDLTASMQAMVANSGLLTFLNDAVKYMGELNELGFKKILDVAVDDPGATGAAASVIKGLMYKKDKWDPMNDDIPMRGPTFRNAPTAGELNAKQAEVAANRNRTAEVAAAAAARAVMENMPDWNELGAKSDELSLWSMQKRGGTGGPQDRAMQEQALRFTTGIGTTAPAKQTADNTAALNKFAQQQLEVLKQILKKLGINAPLEPAPL